MIVGIDLGTTNSLIAIYREGKTEIIPNRLGKLLTPSVVAIDEHDQILIGETAKEYAYIHPESCAKVFKRSMGTNKKFDLNGHSFLAEELNSLVLRSLIEDAEVYLNEKVDEAIISVPAYFNDNQRKATKKAGELIGLKVSRIINEPTASAIAYGVGANDENERCLVFDLGGGTFDVSILEYYKNIMEVHAIAGDNDLGGEDFTLALMELIIDKLSLDKLALDITTLNSLYKIAEKAKCDFVDTEIVNIFLQVNNVPYQCNISLNEYKFTCSELLQRLSKPIEKCLNDARLTIDDIERVILVGGATKLPIIKEFVRDYVSTNMEYTVDPDKSVVIGAALQIGMKERSKEIEEIILTEVCPFTLGTEVVNDNGLFVETGHYLPIIPRNTTIPVSKKQTVYTAYDDQKQVCVKILQGESRLTKNNLLLGELMIDVPPGPKGKEAIEIVYTYDVNSLLEVEVTVLSTKEKKKIVVQNNYESAQDIKERFDVLQYLKQNPREDEENYFVLLKGNRLYEETLGAEQAELEQALYQFEKVLSEGSRVEIKREREKVLELFSRIEAKETKIFLA